MQNPSAVLTSSVVVIAMVVNGNPMAAQDVRLSVDELVGCYELRSIDWTPDLSTLPDSERRLSTPPRFFALTATGFSNSNYRRLLSRYPDDRERLAHGEWMLTSDYELTAMFPRSGFEWLFLIVRHQPGDGQFSGRAVVMTDTRAARQGKVVFDRVECWEK